MSAAAGLRTPPFAALVRRRMAESGVGLRALCRDAGLDPSFFSKVLAGKRSPPAEEEVLRRISGRLGLDAARLVVAAGRVPSEWQGLWSDPGLFEAVDRMLRGRGPEPDAPRAALRTGAAEPRGPILSRRSAVLEDELL